MTIKVYWCPHNDMMRYGTDISLRFQPPEKLINNIPNNVRQSNYYRCPAFSESIRNTYVIKSGVNLSFNINFNTDDVHIDTDNPYLCKLYFPLLYQPNESGQVLDDGFVQFGNGYMFFAEKPLIVSTCHPYLHHNTVTSNGNGLYGEYDCSAWLRPINSSFVLNSNKTQFNYIIKEDDVTNYVKFHTKEKIELIKINYTNEIDRIAGSCNGLKIGGNGKITPLQKCYNYFQLHKHRKAILNEIQRQGNI